MKQNILANVTGPFPEEIVESIVESPNARIERIISYGHQSPDDFWYEQVDHEWVIVLQGAARLEFDDGSEPVSMSAGDHLLIAARQKHRVAWTTPDEPTIWLAVHYS